MNPNHVFMLNLLHLPVVTENLVSTELSYPQNIITFCLSINFKWDITKYRGKHLYYSIPEYPIMKPSNCK